MKYSPQGVILPTKTVVQLVPSRDDLVLMSPSFYHATAISCFVAYRINSIIMVQKRWQPQFLHGLLRTGSATIQFTVFCEQDGIFIYEGDKYVKYI